MKFVLCLAGFFLCYLQAYTQTVYTITADSVKITNTNDTAELIIQNHTQAVQGFLFNKGNGRTEFRKALQKLNDSTYLVGADTLKTGNYVSLSKDETITGAKTFNPSATAVNGKATGTIFSGNFTTTANSNQLYSADFRTPVVNNPNNVTYTALAARFRGLVRFDSLVYFPGGILDALGVRTNTWSRLSDVSGMSIYKPAGDNLNGELLRIQTANTISTTGSLLKAGTVFRDSVNFLSGTQDFSQIRAYPALIQQTGTSGITRGVYVVPYLSGVTDFRGMEVNVDSANGYAFYASGSAPSRFGGLVQYAGNYASQFTTRTMVDKGYVDSVLIKNNRWALQPDSTSIYYNGSVGIGGIASSNSAVKLAVYGTLLSKKIKVSQNAADWPDYVFEPGYTLQPVTDLEAYVATNKHLPGIPSAAEIKKEGMDVADMQARMLKKMEELTLYVIQQEKKIQEQDKLIRELQRKLKQKRQQVK